MPLQPYLPKDPSEFCTNPYDVISSEEEQALKQSPNSLIHFILPDGEGNEKYKNSQKAFESLINDRIIELADKPSFYLYRQESETFSQEGLILGVSLQDYVDKQIVIHEYTREKPLKDRTDHISITKAQAGLVWTVYKANMEMKNSLSQIKKSKPLFNFEKFGYTHLLWKVDDLAALKISEILKDNPIYIADGHHRAASANEYRNKVIAAGENGKIDAPHNYLLTYLASDDQVRIYPYNRVIKKLPFTKDEFLAKLKSIYSVEKVSNGFNSANKHEMAMYCKGEWFKLVLLDKVEKGIDNTRDGLDVSILQDKVLGPILGIRDIRKSDNIFFVGGEPIPSEMEKFITEKGNEVFFNLYPVAMTEIEEISENGRVMPPKSTWFDPKVLSGLVLHHFE